MKVIIIIIIIISLLKKRFRNLFDSQGFQGYILLSLIIIIIIYYYIVVIITIITVIIIIIIDDGEFDWVIVNRNGRLEARSNDGHERQNKQWEAVAAV